MPLPPALMLQGTGSSVGKSLIVAGLCRLYSQRGMNVRPFKPQNMSNNAAVAVDGGEIGRAQALQARAAGTPTSVHMNPVLLKPEAGGGSQIIVQGSRRHSLSAREYIKKKSQLMTPVLQSLELLGTQADLIIAEGAGSPAEINLRTGDIANMGFAIATGLPVVLIGDIDRGGVIASLVGTHEVLDPGDREMVRGFIINKFRGDISLFDDGIREIQNRTGWPCLGIVPYFNEASHLPLEDSADLTNALMSNGSHRHTRTRQTVKIAVPRLPRIANFDDLDPLRLEPSVELSLVESGEPLPGDSDLILIAGSKSTIDDLEALRTNGWDIDILAHHRRYGMVLGICGGYQMLGRTIDDPGGLEGPARTCNGLGLLDVVTSMQGQKQVRLVEAEHSQTGLNVTGYEIHLGHTSGTDCARPMFNIAGRQEGSISKDGLVMGTQLHGIFASDEFRSAFLKQFGSAGRSYFAYENEIDSTLDQLAEHLQKHLDVDLILEIAAQKINASNA